MGTTIPDRKTVRYLRESVDDTAGIERHRQVCLDYERSHNLTVDHEIVDQDESASPKRKGDRPGFTQMMRAVEQGEIGAIVCYHFDRLYRDPRDLEDIIDDCRDHQVSLHSVNLELNLSTDTGATLARILGAISNGEIERKAERQKLGMVQRAGKGRAWWPNRPFGFNLPQRIERNNYKPPQHDEKEAEAIRQAYSDVLSGISLKAIARRWNQAELLTPRGKQWTGMSVRQILLAARNAGLRTYSEVYYVKEKQVSPGSSRRRYDRVVGEPKIIGHGDWEPIISEEIWRGTVAMLKAPDRCQVGQPFPKRKYLLSGLMACGVCGGLLTGTCGGRRRPSYICSHCTKVRRSAQDVDAWVLYRVAEALSANEISRDIYQATHAKNRQKLAELEQQLVALNAEKQSYADQADQISVDMMITISARFEKRISEVQEQRDLIKAQIPHIEDADPLRGLPDEWRERVAWFETRDEDQQRAIITRYFDIAIKPGQASRRPFDDSLVTVTPKS